MGLLFFLSIKFLFVILSMVQVNINDRPYLLPTSWEEVIEKGKYFDVIELIIRDAPLAERYVDLFKTLTGFTSSGLNLTDLGREQLAGHILMEVSKEMDFLFDPDQIILTNPLPDFVHNGVKYTGLEYKLNNQTGKQWCDSHLMQVQYDKTKDFSNLIALMEINYTATVPIDFSELSPTLIWGFYIFYTKADLWWQERFKCVFGGDSDDDEDEEDDLPKKKKKQFIPATGREVKEILFEMAGNKLDDAWDKIQLRTRQDLFFALAELDKKRKKEVPKPV